MTLVQGCAKGDVALMKLTRRNLLAAAVVMPVAPAVRVMPEPLKVSLYSGCMEPSGLDFALHPSEVARTTHVQTATGWCSVEEYERRSFGPYNPKPERLLSMQVRAERGLIYLF